MESVKLTETRGKKVEEKICTVWRGGKDRIDRQMGPFKTECDETSVENTQKPPNNSESRNPFIRDDETTNPNSPLLSTTFVLSYPPPLNVLNSFI